MFNVALIEPQIPQNTGNIARLCAATELNLILVGKLGFSLDDRYLKRAGLDYWEFTRISYQPNLSAFLSRLDMNRTFILTTKGSSPYTEIKAQAGDTFLFGSETAGFPPDLLANNRPACYTIPMKNPNVRSLNLASSVGIVMYAMLAENGFG